ncbi:mitochondrial sodium/calcium exchanger protein-like isoform X2 [Lytechinus variegatus]|uniref:mitochondrial sodium/calcium exchanger protein-like isoform X2 n=1 Tax=Lytechinus variegatus TaxID=7654 RepID=UPI001BB27635|nr:mitochondrial sodium/calcium exchanger protein-like isoform X2 [Lytechinus variegatus]
MYQQLILFVFLSGALSSPIGEDEGELNDDVPLPIIFVKSLDNRMNIHRYRSNLTTLAAPTALPGKNIPCGDYHTFNSSAKKCEFIQTNGDCQNSDGFINYLQVIYCSFPGLRPLGLVCLGLWLIYLLITLGVTAEVFFCPNLDVMARTLKLSQNIAGVTLLAFGNGAPDIFSAIAAITNARDGEAGLAIGALFGAGIFVTTVVAGSIAVTRPFKMVERPFLRDSIFYLVAAFWTFYILYKGSIVLLEAVGYILLYVVYVIVVFVGRKIYQNQKRRKREQEQTEETYTNGIQQDLPGPGVTGGLSATERLAVASMLGVDADVVRSITPQPHQTNNENSNDDDESRSLLSGDAPPPGQVKEFFIGLCPVDIKEWSELAWYSKLWALLKCPMLLCLKATVPVVDYNEPKHNWNRLLNTLNLLLAPVFCAFVTKGLTKTITGGFEVWHLVLSLSFLLAVLVFLTSKPNKQPVYHSVFSYIGFVVAVLWIYSTANEIVNILQMFGLEFYITDAILGLTVLAWGNSIGDLVADVAMARQGFPTMGMSACFGGPMFNMLLGIGISCTIVTIRDGGTFVLNTTHVQLVLALGLAVSLLSSMFIMVASGFRASRFYGVYLFILYIVFLVVALLIEENVIPW